MRRRSFRPALESLDLRITPSDVAGFAVAGTGAAGGGVSTYRMAAPVPVMTYTPTEFESTGGDDSHPLWDEPTDPTGADDGSIWCPMIGE